MAADFTTLKDKTTEELFAQTLEGEYDDECPWDAVSALRVRGTSEVFQEAVNFCNSTDPLKRARGIDILAQLGKKMKDNGPHFDERVSICLHHISDGDIIVLRSAAYALGYLGTEKCIEELIKLTDHMDAGVRHAVAVGLMGNPKGVSSLIKLIEDEDDEVRNWATFSLGMISTGDTPEIRNALKRRLEDSFGEVRAEAMWGLSQRKDPVGLKMLLDCIDDDDECLSGDLMAAAETLDVDYDTPVSDLRAGLRKILESLDEKRCETKC